MASTSPQDEMPQSVEEAGALLGATVIGYGSSSFSTTNPPKGIHSSFATVSPVPSSELLHRLHALRSLLRSAPKDTPLVAAPSLLAGVLMKLLGISSSLAATMNSSGGGDPTKRNDVPPMLSNPIRRVWVQCVVLCHSLGEGLSGNARINLYGFVRDMIGLAGLNPRTARALGGTRVAALEVIGFLLEDPKLSSQLASWSYDIIQLCQKALKSSGNGEPTYRIAAMEAACSVAVASRTAFLKTRSVDGSAQFVLKGALEDRTIFEVVKLLKIALQDKLPEVRSSAARLASLVAPLVINVNVKSPSSPDALAASPTSSLEDIMTLAFKNLDDESAHVSGMWAEALARCMCTSIEYKNQVGIDRPRDPDVGGGDYSSAIQGDAGNARGVRKGVLPAAACDTLPKAMKYLVSVFIKVGGELAAPRAGGNFSTGGRAVRVGFARSLIHLLRLQSSIQSLGDGRALSYKEAILITLSMVGTEMEVQLNPTDRSVPISENVDATTVITPGAAVAASTLTSSNTQAGRNLFGQGRKISLSDACVARLLSARVLREGLSELVAETTQLVLLHELIHLCKNKQEALKGNQLQVILVEISHLLATLGEATASSIEELVPALVQCLRHVDHGVRHEAAVVCAAVTSEFPAEGRRMIREIIDFIQVEHAELMSVASSPKVGSSTDSSGISTRFRFGRNAQVNEVKIDSTLKQQIAIQGMAVTVSMILRDLPSLPGGLPVDDLDAIITVSEILVSTLSNNIMRESCPNGTCTCVRAGFALICGLLTTGPNIISNQIALIFGLWQKVGKLDYQSNAFGANHEMMCIEALLTSMVTFLKYCSELLLSIPDALSRTSMILESLLPSFSSKGRFGSIPANYIAAARLESAKASILEAFAWLPPGSYPMIADSVFGFSVVHIQSAIQNDVACSLLPSLLSKEDSILDALSFSRACSFGDACGLKDLEVDIIALTSDAAHPGDRESAFVAKRKGMYESSKSQPFLGSEVLGMTARDKEERALTVLHEVGTWRKPVDPSPSTKIRLIDAAIQAFASTFGLKSGKEQQKAMDILQSLIPPVYFQVGRSLGGQDQDRTGKSKDNLAATTNVVAVLLSCLKALPMDESTHDIPVGLGPTWMNKASNILLSILPSPSSSVRRAAAEGLGFLATLGAKEDMHFLQSSVLHSLDEVIAGASSQTQARNILQDETQAGRSGGLLTLACMQRNTYQIKERRAAKSRLRGSPGGPKDNGEDSLPAIQIMIRLLPYISGQSTGTTSLSARTSALHALLLLLEYSRIFKKHVIDPEEMHLLKKAIEIVEENFLSAWTIASHYLDQGNESAKVAFEASFLAVMLRLMTFLTPFLIHLQDIDSSIAKRFSTMGIIILESMGFYPVVQCEAIAFFEVLASHQVLLPPHSGGIKYDEHPILCSIPFMLVNITPDHSRLLSPDNWSAHRGCQSSSVCLRATLKAMKVFGLSHILIAEWSDMKAVSLLFAALDGLVAKQTYSGESAFRSVAAPREATTFFCGGDASLSEIPSLMKFSLYLERESQRNAEPLLLRFILLARTIISGALGSKGNDDELENVGVHNSSRVAKKAMERALSDAQPLFDVTSSFRWQVKAVASQIANIALYELARRCRQTSGFDLLESASFNPIVAQKELMRAHQFANTNRMAVSNSYLSFHVADLLTASCVASTATVDQVELRVLQENAMYLLSNVIDKFAAIPDPDEPESSLLGEYVPQVSSCIKSALAAKDEQVNDMTCRLFWAGCDALRSFIEKGTSQDQGVLRRIIRPALFTKKEAPFFEVTSEMPTDILASDKETRLNTRSSLLLKIGKVWTLGSIPLSQPDVSKMMEIDEKCLGVQAAAIAIDGANLLLSHSLSLVGQAMTEPISVGHSCRFFSIANSSEIDDCTKAALAKTWANNLKTAVDLLSKVVLATTVSKEDCETCEAWLKVIVPISFLGLSTAIDAKRNVTKDSIIWATEVSLEDVFSSCLEAINVISGSRDLLLIEETWGAQIESLVILLYKKLLLPVLRPESHRSKALNIRMPSLVVKSCGLLGSVAVARSVSLGDSRSSQLLLSILGPLDMLQKGELDLSNGLVATIVSTCSSAVAEIVENGHASPALIRAMLSLVLSVFVRKENTPEIVRVSLQQLLKHCVLHESVDVSDQSFIATTLAKNRDWAAWSVVVAAKGGIAAEKSLVEVEKALLNPSYAGEQLTALAAIRGLIQSSTTPSARIGRLATALGAEILSVFRAYGILTNLSPDIQSQRLAACADCMKIVLTSYQQFGGDCTEEEVAQFLEVVFEAFIAIIRFNGLPNHPPPQGSLSNASIGRMCAQAITHVARTTPGPFKTCLNGMADHERAVLEFAVRADMSGYEIAAGVAPTKKKLDLKSFKK
ncbi:heat repeat-containing protein [Nitzschia inconspicua]|nr:heat repeat-containing protein [Nitzschia inconspicua]